MLSQKTRAICHLTRMRSKIKNDYVRKHSNVSFFILNEIVNNYSSPAWSMKVKQLDFSLIPVTPYTFIYFCVRNSNNFIVTFFTPPTFSWCATHKLLSCCYAIKKKKNNELLLKTTQWRKQEFLSYALYLSIIIICCSLF